MTTFTKIISMKWMLKQERKSFTLQRFNSVKPDFALGGFAL